LFLFSEGLALMVRCSTRFVPICELLETRLAPAVTFATFKSNPTLGAADSLLIKGTPGHDSIVLTDDGATVAITANGKPLDVSSLSNPVIIRFNLGKGNDRLEYLVPSTTTLVRKIEYTGGPGRNSFLFDSASTSGTGVSLDSGSFVGIAYNGVQGRVQDFRTVFGDVTAAVLSMHHVFGAGNDRGVRVEFKGDVGGDSSVTGLIELGGGTTTGAKLANDLTLLVGDSGDEVIGAGDSAGSSLAFDVIGGARADSFAFRTGFGTLGTLGGAATRIAVNANLAGGIDDGFFANDAAPTLLTSSSLAFTVHGGGGNDNLAAFTGTLGSTLTLADQARLEIALFGDGGADFMEVNYGLVSAMAGDLRLGAGAMFRLLMDGGAGADLVAAQLINTDTTDPTAIFDVQLLGSAGNDMMGLNINDNGVSPAFLGGLALLDGGLGVNTMDAPPQGFGIAGPVRRLNV
jgi:hypothetical protein